MRATRPGESALLLLDVVDLLAAEKIEYAVIGALAAALHGAVRASMDADAVLSLDMRKAAQLERSITSMGLLAQTTRGDIEDPIPGLLRVNDAYGNRVDLLLGLRGLDPQAFSRVLEVPFQGGTLKFIGREDFIAMKAFAGGPIDRVDAERAISAATVSLNLDLVRRLAQGYGRDASELLERMLSAHAPRSD